MSKRPQLETEKRKTFGRKVKKLRREGILPANIYGKKVESTAIQINQVAFGKLYRQTGETDVIDLTVKGEKETRPVLVANVQLGPVSNYPVHADFLQVDLKEKVRVDIPIKFVGQSEAVKAGNMLLELLSEIEVEALPTDLPDGLETDITQLKEIGDEIRVKDIKVPAKIKLQAEPETLVAKIEAPATEEPAEAKPEAAVKQKETSEETETKEKEGA